MEERKCIICEKEFKYYTKRGAPLGGRGVPKRMKKSITCSRNCSKIYKRVLERVLKKRLCEI